MDTVKELHALEADAIALQEALDKADLTLLALRNYADRVRERVHRCKRQLGLSTSAPIRKRKKDAEVDVMANKILAEILSGKPLKKSINAKA